MASPLPGTKQDLAHSMSFGHKVHCLPLDVCIALWICVPFYSRAVYSLEVLTASVLIHCGFGFAAKGAAPPPKKITSWFLSKGQGKTRDDSADYIPHDIYVIGTQEDPQGEKEWLEVLRQSLQEITSISFKVVRNHVSSEQSEDSALP